MSQLQLLRAFVRGRLIAAADEIIRAVERTVADYEEEVSSARGLHSQNQWLNVVVTQEMKLSPLEPQLHSAFLSLDQEDPEPPLIKEEQQELCISQETPFQGLEEDEDAKGSMLSSCVESEDNHVQTPSNTTIFGDCLGTLKEQTQTHIDDRTMRCHVEHVGKNRDVKEHSGFPTEEDPYKCTERSKVFNNPGLLQRHITIHRKKTYHRCTVCSKLFNDKSLLKRHMRTHTGEKTFRCKFCPFSCGQKGHLTIHMRTHTGERPYTCTDCGKGFTQSSNLRSHMKLHSEPQQHSAQEGSPSLDQEDPNPTPIKEEQEEQCISQEKPFQGLEQDEDAKGSMLSTCVESEDDHVQTPSNMNIFGDSVRTLEEQTQTHIHTRTLRCRVYGDHAGKTGDVKDHTSISTEETPYKCRKALTNSGPIQLHMSIHRKKIYHCTVCTKTFNAKRFLEMHMRAHTGEKPFHCKICPVSFTQKGHLKTHMRTHTGERPYTCTYCGKRFTQDSNRKTHMKRRACKNKMYAQPRPF